MEKQLHQNYIKSSNLISGTAALGLLNGLLNFFYSNHIFTIALNITMPIIWILITTGLGLLLKQGINWVKYLLIIWAILELVWTLFIMAVLTTTDSHFEVILSTAQTIMLIWAVVLIFRIPGRKEAYPVVIYGNETKR